MKQMTEEGIQAIRFNQKEVSDLQKEINNVQNKFIAIVLNEKLKMNIPMEFVFNPDTMQYLSPQEIPPGYRVVEIGITKLPICVKPQQMQQ